jgi:PAS domain S-box-containing protein
MASAAAQVVPMIVVGVIATIAFIFARHRWVTNARAQQEAEAALRTKLEASLQAAKESEERFNYVALASRDLVWDWDLKTDAMLSSPAAPALFGYAPEEWPMTTAPWMRILHPEDKARVLEFARRFLLGEHPKYDFRYRGVHKDGRVLHLHTSAVLLRDASGAPARLVGFTRDVTEEVNAEESRLQAQKLEGLGLLAGGIAHDFNNILAVISTSLELATRLSKDPNLAEPLGTATLAVDRAAVLTRQLLAYAGRARLTQRSVEINELVKSISSLLSVSMKPGVKLVHELTASLPQVRGDDGQLQQLVMNLVTNAAEAIGDAEGQVTVRTRLEHLERPPPHAVGTPPLGDVVVLEVSDTGVGMPPEVKARIFDPFFSTKGGGRGLGLSALVGILRVHRGAVTIDTKPGAGTTFTVYFPALVATPEAAADPTPKAMPAPLRARVLLVDDEPMLRKSAHKLLEVLGCAVDEASNGLEALIKIEATPNAWDVVLMDVTMPALNGYQAAKKMREVVPTLPIVLSSGYAGFDASEDLPEGIPTLPKPYDLQALEAVLRRVLPR